MPCYSQMGIRENTPDRLSSGHARSTDDRQSNKRPSRRMHSVVVRMVGHTIVTTKQEIEKAEQKKGTEMTMKK